MDLHYPCPAGRGYRLVVGPDNSPLEQAGLGLLRLAAGEAWGHCFAGQEAVLVILGGSCELRCGPYRWRDLGERADVFSGRATAAYLPPGLPFEVEAGPEVELAVCLAPASAEGEPVLIRPEQLSARVVGSGNFRREIYDIVLDNVPAQRLLVGETYNPAGNWSSYPPHKHDESGREDEVKLEEIYHFRLRPASGFGLQRIYTTDGRVDEAYAVGDGETVVIPCGYHPVVAAPGYQLYYLWVLAGEERRMLPRDDPAHTWVKSVGE